MNDEGSRVNEEPFCGVRSWSACRPSNDAGAGNPSMLIDDTRRAAHG